MNWFFMHLNWTWVFAWGIIQIALLIAQPAFGKEGIIAGFLVMLPVSSWVLIQKRRSLLWLLLTGLGSALWLKSK
jgi:hypothetical protein